MKASEFKARTDEIETLFNDRHATAVMIRDLEGLDPDTDDGRLQISISDSDDYVGIPASMTSTFKGTFINIAQIALADTEAKLVALGVELDVPATVDATSSFSLRNYLETKDGDATDEAAA